MMGKKSNEFYETVGKILDLISEKDLNSFDELVVWCRTNDSDLFEFLFEDKAPIYFLRCFMDDRRYNMKKGVLYEEEINAELEAAEAFWLFGDLTYGLPEPENVFDY